MNSASTDKVYAYRQKKWLGPLVVLFFGACAALFLHKGLASSQGLLINRVIELSPQSARWFFLVLFVLSALFVLAGLLVIFNSLKKPRSITLTADTLTAPKNALSSQLVTLTWREITGLKMQKVNGQQFLQITYPAGKLVIQQAMLPTNDDFIELFALLSERSGIREHSVH